MLTDAIGLRARPVRGTPARARSPMNRSSAPGIVFAATRDRELGRALAHALDREELRIVEADGIERVASEIEATMPRIALLDARDLGAEAAQLCRYLRERAETARLPLIVLTATENVAGRIQALQSGADDSVSVPVNVDELVARIRVLPQRRGVPPTSGHLCAGTIDMDLDGWKVTVEGNPVGLTKKEFLLLRTLIESRGRALSRTFLLERIWALPASIDTRTVDVHVGRLRRKLGPAGRYIITVRNVGFRFDLVPDWISGRGAPETPA